jgi:hypothetical protein
MIHCAGCDASFDLPVLFPADFKGTVAAKRRRGQAVEGISLLSRELGLDLGTAKAIYDHITVRPDTCHRCGQGLGPAEESTCTNCLSLNLNWAAFADGGKAR